jgi:protein-L-isoaspartate(D-aspartate) O-methyltransferase
LKDEFRHKGLRKELIEELKRKGITDAAILNAFDDIPRHYFIDNAFADWAYKDVPFKIGADQTISQPYTVAFMTSLLDVKKGDRIFEVGTGSGYQACVLAYLGAKVYSIERQATLHKKTSEFLEKLGYGQIRLLYGDGYKGYPRFAPFDKIIVTAGAPYIPEDLLSQLEIGGILVIPVDINDDETQEMIKVVRVSETKFNKTSHGKFRFVPMLPGVNE